MLCNCQSNPISGTMTHAVILPESKSTAGSIQPGASTALPPGLDTRALVFGQLKPITSQLLQARNEPSNLQGLLKNLERVIRDADVDGLNSPGILDYILFPLMPALDSVALTRQSGLSFTLEDHSSSQTTASKCPALCCCMQCCMPAVLS